MMRLKILAFVDQGVVDATARAVRLDGSARAAPKPTPTDPKKAAAEAFERGDHTAEYAASQPDQGEGHLNWPMLATRHLEVLRFKGHALAPLIKDGQLLVLDQQPVQLEPEDTLILTLQDGRVLGTTPQSTRHHSYVEAMNAVYRGTWSAAGLKEHKECPNKIDTASRGVTTKNMYEEMSRGYFENLHAQQLGYVRREPEPEPYAPAPYRF